MAAAAFAAPSIGAKLETFTDRRVERYWQLLAIMNGWPQRGPSSTPAWEWLLAGLRAAA